MKPESKKSNRGGKRKGAGRKPNPNKPPKKSRTKPAPEAKAAAPKIEKPKEPAKMGPPFEYDAAIFFGICERVGGGEFLAKICEEAGMPSEATFRRWKNSNDDLRAAYARAREDRADSWADELILIADDGSRDYGPPDPETGFQPVNHDHIQRAKLRVDARKWVMAKHAPKAYGEKIEVTHNGSIGRQAGDFTDDELAAIATGSSAGASETADSTQESDRVH